MASGSHRPPQLHLSLPPNSVAFKRSFEEFGFDLDSPDVAGASASGSGSSAANPEGHERKRARSDSPYPQAGSSGASTSGQSSSSTESASTDDASFATQDEGYMEGAPVFPATRPVQYPAPGTLADVLASSPVGPPRLPTPDIPDVEMPDYLGEQESSLSPDADSTVAATLAELGNDNALNALDGLDDAASQLSSFHDEYSPAVARTPTPPPTLPPLALPLLGESEDEQPQSSTSNFMLPTAEPSPPLPSFYHVEEARHRRPSLSSTMDEAPRLEIPGFPSSASPAPRDDWPTRDTQRDRLSLPRLSTPWLPGLQYLRDAQEDDQDDDPPGLQHLRSARNRSSLPADLDASPSLAPVRPVSPLIPALSDSGLVLPDHASHVEEQPSRTDGGATVNTDRGNNYLSLVADRLDLDEDRWAGRTVDDVESEIADIMVDRPADAALRSAAADRAGMVAQLSDLESTITSARERLAAAQRRAAARSASSSDSLSGYTQPPLGSNRRPEPRDLPLGDDIRSPAYNNLFGSIRPARNPTAVPPPSRPTAGSPSETSAQRSSFFSRWSSRAWDEAVSSRGTTVESLRPLFDQSYRNELPYSSDRVRELPSFRPRRWEERARPSATRPSSLAPRPGPSNSLMSETAAEQRRQADRQQLQSTLSRNILYMNQLRSHINTREDSLPRDPSPIRLRPPPFAERERERPQEASSMDDEPPGSTPGISAFEYLEQRSPSLFSERPTLPEPPHFRSARELLRENAGPPTQNRPSPLADGNRYRRLREEYMHRGDTRLFGGNTSPERSSWNTGQSSGGTDAPGLRHRPWLRERPSSYELPAPAPVDWSGWEDDFYGRLGGDEAQGRWSPNPSSGALHRQPERHAPIHSHTHTHSHSTSESGTRGNVDISAYRPGLMRASLERNIELGNLMNRRRMQQEAQGRGGVRGPREREGRGNAPSLPPLRFDGFEGLSPPISPGEQEFSPFLTGPRPMSPLALESPDSMWRDSAPPAESSRPRPIPLQSSNTGSSSLRPLHLPSRSARLLEEERRFPHSAAAPWRTDPPAHRAPPPNPPQLDTGDSRGFNHAISVLRGDGLSETREMSLQEEFQARRTEAARASVRARAEREAEYREEIRRRTTLWGSLEDDGPGGSSHLPSASVMDARRRRLHAQLRPPPTSDTPVWDPLHHRLHSDAMDRERQASEEARQQRLRRLRGRVGRRMPGIGMGSDGMMFSELPSYLEMPEFGGRGNRRMRALGDYIRDEDFDSSYDNLLNIASTLGEVKPRCVPEHIIKGLPTAFHKDWATEGSDPRCPICLDDYKSLDRVLKLPDCGHWLHQGCLEQWLRGASTCPVCRKRVKGKSRGTTTMQDPGPSGSQPGPWRRRDDDDDNGPGRSNNPFRTLDSEFWDSFEDTPPWR